MGNTIEQKIAEAWGYSKLEFRAAKGCDIEFYVPEIDDSILYCVKQEKLVPDYCFKSEGLK